MATSLLTQSRYHVLLVGIDDYSVKPLNGCVNDIDAIQDLLLRRLGLPQECIARLASPHPGVQHDTTIAARPATLANLRAALTELGTDKVAPDDRVFIYYSGHGSRVPVITDDGQLFQRESLVPADFMATPDGYQLLFDYEFNQLLTAIAARTRSMTVVLDCCHSAGASRLLSSGAPSTSRFISLKKDLGFTGSLPLPKELAPLLMQESSGMRGSMDDCQVVAACLNNELAQEDMASTGRYGGLLTRALLATLAALPDEALATATWAQVWQTICAEVETANPAQHPWMAGTLARIIFAGPPVAGDAGLPVTRIGPNGYTLDAGTLAGVTRGAKVAVYGSLPPLFPPLESDVDRKARVGCLLLVTSSELSRATAEAEGAPFELPAGARCRLVKAGEAERLRCAIVSTQRELADQIVSKVAASPLLQVVADERLAQVRLEQLPAPPGAVADWTITDDVYGARPEYPVLLTVPADRLGRARALLEHYYHFTLPVRMAMRCTDFAGALRVSLLACPPDRELTPAEAQQAQLPEAGTPGDFPCELLAGSKICVRINNTASAHLRVTVLSCSASGKVQLLGDQIIDARSHYVFWARNVLGRPFLMSPPAGTTQGIDRLVAIGTTALQKDLSYLRLDTSLAQVLGNLRSTGRDFGDDDGNSPPAEQWTATQVIIRTRAP